MPDFSTNIYHDIRPIGPSGSVLVALPTGSRAGTAWQRLSPNRLYDDLEITLMTANNVSFLVGGQITNPIFFITYNETPSGATITSAGTGVQDLNDPYTAHAWIDSFPTGIVNSARTFTVTASGEFGSTSASVSLYYLQRAYWGVGATGTYNSSFITALSNNAFTSGHAREITVVPTGNEYIFYAYRSAAGPATFTNKATNIKGGFILDGSGVSFTNANGYTESYSVYKSDYPGLGNLNIIIGSG